MSTVSAFLRSQDCLRNGLRHETLTLTPPLRPLRTPDRNHSFTIPSSIPNTGNPSTSRSRRRKRSPPGFQPNQKAKDRSQSRSMVVKFPAKNLVMGQVKILKRGEMLCPAWNNVGICVAGEYRKAGEKSEEDLDLILGSTDRLGPDPETVQKQIRVSEFKVVDGIYAGSGALFASPPPSSVPVPGFLGNNGAATNDLRRLLRLDLM